MSNSLDKIYLEKSKRGKSSCIVKKIIIKGEKNRKLEK